MAGQVYFSDIRIVGADVSDQPVKPDYDTITYMFSAELPPTWYAALAAEFREISSRPIMRIPEMRPRHDQPRCIDLFVDRDADAATLDRINDYLEQATRYANARYRAELRRAGGSLSRTREAAHEAARLASLREQLRKRFLDP
jgi:hypothetical protein